MGSSSLIACRYSWLKSVPSVEITPIRFFLVASTAACAPGLMTPTMGMSNFSRAWLRAAAVAVLQAMTTSLTSRLSRYSMMSNAKPLTSSW